MRILKYQLEDLLNDVDGSQEWKIGNGRSLEPIECYIAKDIICLADSHVFI